jgi:hypothetical protein
LGKLITTVGGRILSEQSKSDRAAQIRHTLKLLRQDIDYDIHQVKRSAAALTKWQYYIKKYPWASIGVAAAIGYLLLPKKKVFQGPDTKTLEKLIRKNRPVLENNPKDETKNGVMRTAFTFLAGLALRAATAKIVHHLTSGMDQGVSVQNNSTRSPVPGFGEGINSSTPLSNKN